MNEKDISLRALELQDKTLLHSWENDSEAWSSSSTYNPLSSAFIESYISSSSASLVEQGQLALIIETADAQPVGYIQMLDYNAVERRVALGIYISKEYRRQGYATRALSQCLDYLRGRMRCEHFYACILESNTPSQHLFSQLGFVHTATLPHWQWTGASYEALYYYQLWIE